MFDKLRQELGVDGETLFTIVKCPHLLLLSKLILLDCREAIGAHVPLVDWWALRLIGVYQNLFEERTATLTSLSASLIEKRTLYDLLFNSLHASICICKNNLSLNSSQRILRSIARKVFVDELRRARVQVCIIRSNVHGCVEAI